MNNTKDLGRNKYAAQAFHFCKLPTNLRIMYLKYNPIDTAHIVS